MRSRSLQEAFDAHDAQLVKVADAQAKMRAAEQRTIAAAH